MSHWQPQFVHCLPSRELGVHLAGPVVIVAVLCTCQSISLKLQTMATFRLAARIISKMPLVEAASKDGVMHCCKIGSCVWHSSSLGHGHQFASFCSSSQTTPLVSVLSFEPFKAQHRCCLQQLLSILTAKQQAFVWYCLCLTPA